MPYMCMYPCLYMDSSSPNFDIIQGKEDKYQLFIYFCFCLKRYISVHDIKFSIFVHNIKFSSCHIFLAYIFISKGINDYYFPIQKQNKTQTVSTLIEVDIHFCYLQHKLNYFQDIHVCYHSFIYILKSIFD